MRFKFYLKWFVVFSLLIVITVYTFFGITNARLLPSASAISSTHVRNFYMEDGQEINLSLIYKQGVASALGLQGGGVS